uniref:Uncharacterized protein n=1 Tax=Tanacetum cinerariifolium TaxID=118510 RepID=A0A699HY81_TANCI|nr:hypothetical protein [Tanacetum cinerariifolium]
MAAGQRKPEVQWFYKWVTKEVACFFQSLRNTNHVKESELASLFGKQKCEENHIDSIYETNIEKTLVSATPLSTAFISTFTVQDIQDSLDDEEDLPSHPQAKTRVSLMKHMNEMKKLKSKLLWHLLMKKESLWAKKVPAMVNGLRSLYKRPKDLIFVKSSTDNLTMSITTGNKPMLSKAENSTLPNHDTNKIPSDESERNTTDHSVAILDSLITDYDSSDESLVCNAPLPLLVKLASAEPISGPRTIKSILKSLFIPIGGIYGEVWVNTFRNAIGAHYLSHSREYVAPLSIDIVRPWFETIGYGETVLAKETLKKSLLPPSEATKGGSSKAPTGSKTGHLKRKKESSSAMDFNPSQTSASTLVVAKMHKEDQQATGNDASAVSTTEVDLGKSAPNDFVPHQKGPDERSKNYTPDHTFAWTNPNVLVDKTKSTGDGSQTAHPISGTKVDTRSAFIDDENQDDEPFITLDESSEENAKRNKDTHAEHKSTLNQRLKQDKQKAAVEIATLKAQSVFPNINQLTEHLVSSMKPEFSKLLSSHDFSSSIPTELKELPTKITALSRETLEALPGLLNKVVDTLNRFASILNAHNKGVSLAGKSTASPVEGEKNTNPLTKDVELENLVDLMGIYVVEEYHKKKLLYNKYFDKMLKRNKNPKITKCKVLTKKGPIILKIYKEDGSEEVITNLKVSDLHLAE